MQFEITEEFVCVMMKQNNILLEQNKKQSEQISELTAQIEVLTQKIAELTEKNNKNSNNSSKPPSVWLDQKRKERVIRNRWSQDTCRSTEPCWRDSKASQGNQRAGKRNKKAYRA